MDSQLSRWIGAFKALSFRHELRSCTTAADPPPAPGADDEKLERFQWGLDLGKARAGFSGLPMIQVFVDENIDEVALDACLESPEIAALMPSFTGILISPEDEDMSPRRLRRKGEDQVVVRRLNGKVLGILPPGFTCVELLEILERSLRSMVIKPKKSPIYRRLLESPDAIDRVIERGEPDRARKYVEFLMELEAGADRPAGVPAPPDATFQSSTGLNVVNEMGYDALARTTRHIGPTFSAYTGSSVTPAEITARWHYSKLSGGELWCFSIRTSGAATITRR